ncbi:sensor histidine kinase [Streptomyces uncialis]|uniref:sensor histidine kinase n=1 Tax=Streptomyces uncialis TaxID=1048205 RepID=UPI0038112655
MPASATSPLLKRLPPGLWTLLAWYAAAVAPIVEYVVLTPRHKYSLSYPGEGLDPFGARALLTLAFALVFAAAALTRRRAGAAYGLLILGTVVSTVAWRQDEIPPTQFLALDIALCHIAATRPRRTSLTAGAAALAVPVGYLLVRLWTGNGSGTASEPFMALTVVIAWLVGHSAHQARAHTEELHARAAAQAVIAERLRIAREMHDTVAHSIGIIALQAGAAARIVETRPGQAREAMLVVEREGRETLSGLRRMLGTLRQADEERSSAFPGGEPAGHGHARASRDPAPGLADLERLAATTTDAGVRVEIRRLGGHRPLPAATDLAAFRIVQESVTNVVRHSGADSCRVDIDHRAHELLIEVSDRGPGTGTAGDTGYGLVGMRERVALLHGEFTAGPRAGGGFVVTVRLPVPAAADATATGARVLATDGTGGR